MCAQRVEERLRGREFELARLALFQRTDHVVLLGGAELHERLVIAFAAISIELGETAPIEILLIRVSARKREIDVVDDDNVVPLRSGEGSAA